MHHLKKRGYPTRQIDKLGVISLVSSLGMAFVATIWAVYLESLLKNPSYVGFAMTLFTILAGISYIIFIPLIEKHKKTTIYIITLILYIISYLLFSVLSAVWAIILLGGLIAVVSSLRITSFGIILRDKSKDSSVSKNISLIYTFLNLSWLIGPLIAGFVAEKYGIRSIFAIAALLILLSLTLFKTFNIKDNRTEERVDKNILKVLINFLKNKDRRLIYIISGGITFWWTLIYIYMPIYIIENGFTSSMIGYFLAAIVLPLVILEYKFGKLTAKIGFKKMFFYGYMIAAVLAAICFFLNSNYLIMGTLVLASIGLAMLEPTTEAYFFDIVSTAQRDKFYGPYNTTIDLNSAISTFAIALILLALPFKFAFAFIAICMFAFALISLKIKNVIESKRK